MKEHIAYCGIDCSHCDIRRAANDHNFAVELAEKFRERHPDAVPEWFKCQGCKGPDELVWSEECQIRACAKGKEIENCSECADFKCQLIRAFEDDPWDHHTQAVRRLEKLRKDMLPNLVKEEQ